MTILRLFFQAIKALGSETSSSSLAAAFAAGIFFGWIPAASLQAGLVVALVLLLRVNLTAAMASAVVSGLTFPLVRGSADRLGRALLENEGLTSFWTTWTHNPILSLTRFDNSTHLGGTLLGLVALVPAFFLGKGLVQLYRSRVEGRLASSPLGRALGQLKIVHLFRRLTSPFAS